MGANPFELAPARICVRRELTEAIECLSQFIEKHDLRTEEVLGFSNSFGAVSFHLNYDAFCQRGWDKLATPSTSASPDARTHLEWKPERGLRVHTIVPHKEAAHAA